MTVRTAKRKTGKIDWNKEGDLPYTQVPAFKSAYDCYKECQKRLRNVPADTKGVARDIKAKLMRIIVCIAHARLGIRTLESLREAVDLAIETQVTIRVLKDTHAISVKDMAFISEYSDSLARQMIGWSQSEERKNQDRNPQQARHPDVKGQDRQEQGMDRPGQGREWQEPRLFPEFP